MGWAKLEEASTHHYRHYTPLVEAATQTIAEAQDTHRVYTGIPQFDAEMRGVGRGHMLNLVGYSHSGKTLVLLNMLQQNRSKRIAYFCPDETGPLVLTKLTTILTGVSAKELEARVADGDEDAIQLLKSTAVDQFPHLAVFDEGLTPNLMEAAYNELVDDVWDGEPADMVIVDYVDLLEEAGDTPPLKFNWLKAFGKRHKVPMILIHQTSRTAGADGKAMTISSGNFGGEQHATFQVGVRRKKNSILSELADQRSKATPNLERIRDLEHDLLVHEYTITLNLVKNKRPGGRTVDEIDFELMIHTGEIRQLAPGQMPEQWSAAHSLAAKEEAAPRSDAVPNHEELDYDGYEY